MIRSVFWREQNNGYIYQNFLKILYRRRKTALDLSRILTINTLDQEGRPRFIHSGAYEQLLNAFGLAPAQIAVTIRARIGGAREGVGA